MSGFSEAERRRVREGLLAAGREQFARYGLSKTTIAELTDAVGIADSTFYRFFDSKEALYAAVLGAQGEAVAERVLGRSFERHPDDPERAIEAFLGLVCEEIETDPLTRQLLVGDDLDRLRAEPGPDEREADRQQTLSVLLPQVEEWVAAGRLTSDDAELVVDTIGAVSLVALHREDIGPERYPAVRDELVAAVARGLTD